MAEKILMPRLSDTMTEGTIVAWQKAIGDKIDKGDVIAEVETDKATMDLESFQRGVMLYQGVKEGEAISVNSLLAVIGEEGEDIQHLLNESDNTTSTPKETTTNSATAVEIKSTSPSISQNDMSKHEAVVIMPRLSDTMEQGTIAAWHKEVGDSVEKGDVLAEIETDKATMDLESFKAGTLLYVSAGLGGSVPVNSLLCIIGDKDTPVNDIVASVNAVGSLVREVTQEDESSATVESQSLVELSMQEDIAATTRAKASPLARKMAKQHSIPLHQLQGTGDNGRIVKRDIENQLADGSPLLSVNKQENSSQSTEIKSAFTQPPTSEHYTDFPVSKMRSVIANRLLESKQKIPHFYLKKEVCFDEIIKQRVALNKISPVKVSFNDIIIKACATALKMCPEINASWLGQSIRQHHYVHIGSAVAIPDGIIVPVIKHADLKSLSTIAQEAKTLYQKARNQKLNPAEFSGGCMTISNLGMMDIDDFSAIINPPESCILAVGKVKDVVVAQSGNSFGVEKHMTLTLSCDHRVVDGALGAKFINTIAQLIENPLSLLV